MNNIHVMSMPMTICFISAGDGKQELHFLNYLMTKDGLTTNQISLILIDIAYEDVDFRNKVYQRMVLAGFSAVVMSSKFNVLIVTGFNINLFCAVGFQIAFMGSLETILAQKEAMKEILTSMMPFYGGIDMWLYDYSFGNKLPGWDKPRIKTFGEVMAPYMK